MMMLRSKLLPLFGLALSVLLLFPHAYFASGTGNRCGPTFCGNVNISDPFRLNTQPRKCGFEDGELVCENNRTIFPNKLYGKFYVEQISYFNYGGTIHFLDVNLVKDNCSFPTSSYPPSSGSTIHFLDMESASVIYLVNCKMKMMNSSAYIDACRCTTTNRSNSTNFFYFLDGGTPPSDMDSCTIEARVPIMLLNISGLSTFDIYNNLMMGVQLSWISVADSYAYNWAYNWLGRNSFLNM